MLSVWNYYQSIKYDQLIQEDEYDVRREAAEEDSWIPSREIIQYLLDAGADPKIKDDIGRTAEDYYNIRCQKE